MALTEEQKKILQDKAAQRGATSSVTSTTTPSTSIFDKYGLPQPTRGNVTKTETPTPSLKDRLSSLGTGALDIGKTIVEGVTEAPGKLGETVIQSMDENIAKPAGEFLAKQIKGTSLEKPLVATKPAVEAITTPSYETIKSGKEAIGALAQTAATAAPIGRAAGIVKSIGEAAGVGGLYNLGGSLQKDETAGETALSTLEGAALLGGGVGVLKGIGKGLERLMTPAEELVKNKILELYNKSVKPTITGKGTAKQVEQYEDKVLSGVKSIVDNKANLKFTDEYGDIIKGESPKSLSQAAEAIDQTKKSIFQKYDTMAKQAGESGATVETQPVIDELSTIINNKSVALANPKAITYAKELINRLAKTDEKGNIIGYEILTPSETQDVIQHLNKSLESFYKNPTYDSATQASIDALFANKLREGLDGAVSKLSGEYQALKNEYGALSSIEKDVVKASLRDARKNIKGLVDFSDILSGGELVNGLISMSPTSIAKAGVMKGIAEYIKYLNNPNRIISKVFQNAEKLPAKGTKAAEEVIQNVPNQSPKNSLLQMNPKETSATTESMNIIPETIPQTTKNASGKVDMFDLGGAAAGGVQVDEEGNVDINPAGAVLGAVGAKASKSLAKFVSPASAKSIAKKMDDADTDILNAFRDEYAVRKLTDETEAKALNLLKTMGIDAYGLETKQAKEVIDKLLKEKSLLLNKTTKTVSKELQPLAEEARKYKSAEQFVKKVIPKNPNFRDIDPEDIGIGSLNIKDIKSSWDADIYARNRDIPIENNIDLMKKLDTSKIKKIEKSPVGRIIEKPILVKKNVNGGEGYRIYDGNHRYLQALKNGDTEIPAVFLDNSGGIKLTDLYNKVNGKK